MFASMDFHSALLYNRVMNLEEVKNKILPVFDEFDISYAGVFGSVARGEAGPDSDIDILVKFKNPPTFEAYLKLDERLRFILKKEIDLVTEGAVDKFLRPHIQSDLKLIYGQR